MYDYFVSLATIPGWGELRYGVFDTGGILCKLAIMSDLLDARRGLSKVSSCKENSRILIF